MLAIRIGLVSGPVPGFDDRQRRILEGDFAIGGVSEDVEAKRFGLLDARSDHRRVGEFAAAAHQLPTAGKIVRRVDHRRATANVDAP
jgi:hypothetical protein